MFWGAEGGECSNKKLKIILLNINLNLIHFQGHRKTGTNPRLSPEEGRVTVLQSITGAGHHVYIYM